MEGEAVVYEVGVDDGEAESRNRTVMEDSYVNSRFKNDREYAVRGCTVPSGT